MRRIGSTLKAFFSKPQEETLEEIEDMLIASDIGALVTNELMEELSTQKEAAQDRHAALEHILSSHLRAAPFSPDKKRLNVILLVGVNGTGKTTTAAKLTQHFRTHHGVEDVVFAACDTYRAAAMEQLAIHADRLGVRVVRQHSGADPAAVLYDSIESAKARGVGTIIADTAGRMQTRDALMAELGKIESVVRKMGGNCLKRTLLVIDATTGQNALHQAEVFHDAIGVDSVVLSKYDSGAGGGILVPVSDRLGLGCSFLGTGEGYDDFELFDARTFARRLLGL